jgi:hypothetical protein
MGNGGRTPFLLSLKNISFYWLLLAFVGFAVAATHPRHVSTLTLPSPCQGEGLF